MIYARRTVSFLLTLTFLVAYAVTASAQDDLATQIDIEYERFQLDNGLTVLVHSDHSTPTVFVGMWYGVGSKDEPEGKTGFAHQSATAPGAVVLKHTKRFRMLHTNPPRW